MLRVGLGNDPVLAFLVQVDNLAHDLGGKDGLARGHWRQQDCSIRDGGEQAVIPSKGGAGRTEQGNQPRPVEVLRWELAHVIADRGCHRSLPEILMPKNASHLEHSQHLVRKLRPPVEVRPREIEHEWPGHNGHFGFVKNHGPKPRRGRDITAHGNALGVEIRGPGSPTGRNKACRHTKMSPLWGCCTRLLHSCPGAATFRPFGAVAPAFCTGPRTMPWAATFRPSGLWAEVFRKTQIPGFAKVSPAAAAARFLRPTENSSSSRRWPRLGRSECP
jgi:hypothetical protein